MKDLSLGYQRNLIFRTSREIDSAWGVLNSWFLSKKKGFKFRAIKHGLILEVGHDWSGYVKEAIRVLEDKNFTFRNVPFSFPMTYENLSARDLKKLNLFP